MLDGGGGGGGASSEATGLFPYAESDGFSASPSTVSGLADGIQGAAGNLEVLNPDIDSAHLPANTGTAGVLHTLQASAPQPTKENVTQVLLATLCASGATRLFGTDGVQAYNDKMDELRSEYDSEKARIMASDCGVAAATYPDGATQSEKDTINSNHASDVAAAQASALGAVKTRLLKKKSTYKDDPLDAAADKTKGQLNKGPTDENIQAIYAAGGLPLATVAAFPGLHLQIDPGKLPSDLANKTPAQLAKYLVDHPEITDPNILLNLDDEVEAEIGRLLADQARALIPYPIDGAHISALTKQLDRFGLGVDGQFIKALGGADTLDLVNIMGAWAGGESGTEAKALAEAMRDAVGNATTVLPEADARAFANQFVDHIKEWSDNDVNDPEANRGMGLFPPHLALSYLLDDQYHGTAFLDTLGDRLDDYERNDPYFSSWSALSNDDRYSGIWENLMDSDEGAFDPMSAYMSALGHNGDASLQFFTEGNDRQEYWIHDRVWTHDDFEGLMGALDSATTDSSTIDDPDAARLVSNAVHLLVTRDDNDWPGDGDEFKPGDINGEAATSLAHMIGTYMASVDYANTEGGSGVGVHSLDARADLKLLGMGDDMPIFDRLELKELFQTGLSNEDGFMAMREAVSTYQKMHLTTVLAHSDDPNFYEIIDDASGQAKADGIWPNATNADARLEGLLMDSIGEVDIADGKEKDDQIKAWVTLGQRAIWSVPAVPAALVPLQVLGAGTIGDGIRDALATNEAQAIHSANDAAELAMISHSGMLVDVLHDSGAVTDDELHAAATEVGMSEEEYRTFFPGPGASFPDGDDLSDPNNQRLRDMMNLIANNEVRTNSWRLNYENAFHDYEEELGR